MNTSNSDYIDSFYNQFPSIDIEQFIKASKWKPHLVYQAIGRGVIKLHPRLVTHVVVNSVGESILAGGRLSNGIKKFIRNTYWRNYLYRSKLEQYNVFFKHVITYCANYPLHLLTTRKKPEIILYASWNPQEIYQYQLIFQNTSPYSGFRPSENESIRTRLSHTDLILLAELLSKINDPAYIRLKNKIGKKMHELQRIIQNRDSSISSSGKSPQ